MNFLCFGDKNKQSILFIHGMASTAMLCYEPILKRLSDYYVILTEVDSHSERTSELVRHVNLCIATMSSECIETVEGCPLFCALTGVRYSLFV